MKSKNYLAILFATACFVSTAQNKVCTSKNQVEDLNSISKCAIERFKKSNNKEFVQISTRPRVVRRRNTRNLLKIKKDITAISKQKLTINNVDNVPLFIDCTSGGNQLSCFNQNMQKHIDENLRYPEGAYNSGIEDRVLTTFTISVDGTIKNIKTESSKSNALLETEAKRVISNLPKFKPAKHNGITTDVKHKIYVNFNLPSSASKLYANANNNATNEEFIRDYVRFDQVTSAPVFITCADNQGISREECIKETIVSNMLDNLTYPFDAASEGIEGRIWVRFIVDKDGYVKNIATSGPDNAQLLEEEAKRLVTLLPKFLPGKVNDNYVNVEYFIPIDFQLDE